MKNPMLKKCTGCGEEKPATLEYFTKDNHNKLGLTAKCNKCRSEKQKAWMRQNPEKVKQANLKHREKRKDFYNSPEGILSSRRAHLKRMYGISLEDYDKMSEEQNHKCQICGKTEMNYRNKVLCVDHNHSTGKVRGLLCGLCNSGLGKFLENKQYMLNAIKYLEKYEESSLIS